MAQQFPPVQINFAKVQVVGWPGFSLVVIVIAIAIQFPEARWLLLSGIVGGALVAAALVTWRRRHRAKEPTHLDVR